MVERFIAAVDRFHAGAGAVASWLVLVMVLVAAGNSVARYAGRYLGSNLTSNAAIELQWYLFSLVFLLGAADVLRRDAHIRVDVLYGRLSRRRRAWIDVTGTVLFLLPFCAFALITTSPSVAASVRVLEGSPDPGGLPRYPLKAAVLVSFGMLGLQGLVELARRGRALREGGP